LSNRYKSNIKAMISKNIEIQLAWVHLNLSKARPIIVDKVIEKGNLIFGFIQPFPIRRVDESKESYLAFFISYLQGWIEDEAPENICDHLKQFEKLINT